MPRLLVRTTTSTAAAAASVAREPSHNGRQVSPGTLDRQPHPLAIQGSDYALPQFGRGGYDRDSLLKQSLECALGTLALAAGSTVRQMGRNRPALWGTQFAVDIGAETLF